MHLCLSSFASMALFATATGIGTAAHAAIEDYGQVDLALFDIGFESPDSGYTWNGGNHRPVSGNYVAAYNLAGGMTMLTNDDSSSPGTFRRAGVVEGGGPFVTQHLRLFSHSIQFGGGDTGKVSLRPPIGTNDPLLGTDVWPVAFTFGMAASAQYTLGSYNVANDQFTGIELFSHRGTTGTLDDLLRVRYANSQVLLDHDGGTTVLLGSYTTNVASEYLFVIDWQTSSFIVEVNGVAIGGSYGLLSTGKNGIGGFRALGGPISAGDSENYIRFDNLQLFTLIPEPASAMILAAGCLAGWRRRNRMA